MYTYMYIYIYTYMCMCVCIYIYIYIYTYIRIGKGFTLDELREAKISIKLAPTIGIAVDHRRRTEN